MKKRGKTLQDTVTQLEMLAAASALGSFLVERGLVSQVIIIPPASLSKPTWPSTKLN